MVDSHFNLPEEKWDRVVGRSEKAVCCGWQNTSRCYINESGSGGLKTTAIDILKFTEMIRNDGMHEGKHIMSHFSVREMKTNQNTNLLGEWDAHGGYGGCKFVIDPEEGLTYESIVWRLMSLPIIFLVVLRICFIHPYWNKHEQRQPLLNNLRFTLLVTI